MAGLVKLVGGIVGLMAVIALPVVVIVLLVQWLG